MKSKISDETIITEIENTEELDLNSILKTRREKLVAWRKDDEAYPNDFKPRHTAAEINKTYAERSSEDLEKLSSSFSIAGRIMLRRVMGKASFIHLQDRTGRIQLYVRRETVGEGSYEEFKKWDVGDIVGAVGTLFKTKTGELTVCVTQIKLLVKSLRPLPEKFHGLSDIETRYRQRYLDLLVNEKTRHTFLTRAKIVNKIREFFTEKDFIEVETPMMHPLVGGAAARPFITHHNTLDMDLYLRIAPELYLKRCVVGGFEKVFEINRNFRNEGMSIQHNPEFTMLEFYQAYADYEDLLPLTESLFRYLATSVLDNSKLHYQGLEIDLAQPFQRLTVKEAVLKYNPSLSANDLDSLETLQSYAKSLGISLQDQYGIGKILIEIFEKTAEDQLLQPTFIMAYPTEVSPLSRRNDQDPMVTDRFELFIAGFEVANGFSELNDPEDQAERFLAQVRCKAAGDLEAMEYDEDYIKALEYGMPPTAGEGIGIDRLVMLFTDSPSIRDVILFPQLRKVE